MLDVKLRASVQLRATQGSTFRIYQIGSLEVRSTQVKFGQEKVGAIFSSRSLAEEWNCVTCYMMLHVLCLRTYVITRSEQQPRLGLRSVCLCLFMSCSCFSSSVQLQPLFAPWLKEHENTRSPHFVAFFLSFFLSFGIYAAAQA